MCRTRILSAKGQTIVTSCKACELFYIFHNNLMLSFTREAFISFKQVVCSLVFESSWLAFPGGQEKIILHTPNEDISFSFAEEEFELFKMTIDEAIYMKEIYLLMQ